MLSKLSIIALLAVVFVAVSADDGPFCTACLQIIGAVRQHYKDDFSKVTVGELEGEMDNECDNYTEGFADLMCKKLISESKVQLLDALKAGKNATEVCKAGTIC
ncbi:hypothetical protein QR680_008795 [Steinernema hermaphroditum]|uniref:Saposin B-type domain-containing protein n=1 Tax=Steinernema hermaphroditum TaxID=289476 RepID=A0AA39IJV9_9BILA|nr:hypothetical protein QR680_008795 [Steinernema hermaphroditum]